MHENVAIMVEWTAHGTVHFASDPVMFSSDKLWIKSTWLNWKFGGLDRKRVVDINKILRIASIKLNVKMN